MAQLDPAKRGDSEAARMKDANGKEIRVGDTVTLAKPNPHSEFVGSAIVEGFAPPCVLVARTGHDHIPAHLPALLIVVDTP